MNGANGAVINIQEKAEGRAATQRLDANAARSCKQIQPSAFAYLVAQDVEEILLDSINDGPRPTAGNHLELAAFCLAANNPNRHNRIIILRVQLGSLLRVESREEITVKEKEIMSSESDNREFGRIIEQRPERPGGHRPSLFWPIVFIAAGGYFLMLNAGLVPPMSWTIILKLWPVPIIVAGLDIFLRRMTGFLGSLLGVALALALIAGLGYLMLNHEDYPELFVEASPEEGLQQQRQDIAISDVDSATMMFEMGPEPATIDTLAGEALVVLDANTARDLELVMSGPSSEPTISLESSERIRTADDWPGWLVRRLGGSADEEQEAYVNLSINPETPTRLEIDGGAGPLDVNVGDAAITAMQVHVGYGPMTLNLPDGGRYEATIEGGYGPLDIVLPSDLEARIEVVSDGPGPFELSPSGAFREIEQGDGGEGIWETPGFQDAENAVTIVLEMGFGPVTITYGGN